jgi:hypothetical protein
LGAAFIASTTLPESLEAMLNKELTVFGKSKDDSDQLPATQEQHLLPAEAKSAQPAAGDQISTISHGVTVIGKIVGEGTVHLLGQSRANFGH